MSVLTCGCWIKRKQQQPKPERKSIPQDEEHTKSERGGVGFGWGWLRKWVQKKRLDVRRGENSIRKNQCDSIAPLGVFSVSLCAVGMVPETPLGQKDLWNTA